jgi:hypothetical protein
MKGREVLKVWLLMNLLAGTGYADIKVDKNVVFKENCNSC